MDKRYQVFVSSTFRDLQDERQEVIQALLELDCIPAGMELFPAADADQWSLIKKVIDDCDYYLLIVGGRYGSLGPGGLSYTEMEYRYALDTKKPIMGFLHQEPGQLVADRTEKSEEGLKKLKEFRELVQQKLCRFWTSPSDLGSQVSRSLIKLIKSNPAVGWVRADQATDATSAQEILRLKKMIDDLKAELAATATHPPEGSSAFAQGDDGLTLRYTFSALKPGAMQSQTYQATCVTTWNALFAYVSPRLMDDLHETSFVDVVSAFITGTDLPGVLKDKDFRGATTSEAHVNANDFQTVKVQLRALGLIVRVEKPRTAKSPGTLWTLTPYGDDVMTRLRAVPRAASPTSPSDLTPSGSATDR